MSSHHKGVCKSLLTKTHVNKWDYLTGAKYTGRVLASKKTMDGFGMYEYPDGSQYVGNFVDGHFHGTGKLQLSAPYGMTFSGTFEKGVLISISEIDFADGLYVNAQLDNDGQTLKFDKWLYCTTLDRRFFIEHVHGLQGIGPDKYETANGKGRPLLSHNYDVEEGIYSETTGLLYGRRPPFSQLPIYVDCQSFSNEHGLTSDWIKKNCRYGGDVWGNIMPSVHHKIIYNNIRESVADGVSCNNEVEKRRGHCFGHTIDANANANAKDSIITPPNETTTSCTDSDASIQKHIKFDAPYLSINTDFNVPNDFDCNNGDYYANTYMS